jgi:YidC/Oxa1 family membrane protein insertase
MDNQRLLIWAIFALLAWMTWNQWQAAYGPQPEAVPATQEQPAIEPLATEGDLPELGAPDVAAPSAPGESPAAQAAPDETAAPVITVKTDVFELQISTEGGTLQGATLLNYPVAKDRPDTLVRLLSTDRNELGLIRGGLRAAGATVPDHKAVFTAKRTDYDLGGADEIVVPLRWSNDAGVTVEKRFIITRGSYVIRVEQILNNGSSEELKADSYTQVLRRSFEQERSMFDVDSYSFDGPVIFDGEKSEKMDRDDLQKGGAVEYTTDIGWVGTIQHHFVNAIVPEQSKTHILRVELTAANDVAVASVVSQRANIAAGSSKTFATTLFVGPKLQSQLEEVHPKLKLTVDYGWLTILSQPLFWLLSIIFGFVHNWGVAIIVVTILIKAAFYKLTESSGRSMAKMRNLQPRMKALQDRYKDDRQALSQAMMDLYKREKVNPAAGCLPILIQMPFFLAFYWVLLESVEMRQAPFALWITDLSSRDPYFILPLIMGAAMFFQQKLNPAPTDPVQAKVMQIMPVMFTGFFAFFPSGLVLYWCTNTLLSIAQQWKINKLVERESKEQKSAKKKSKKDKE